MDVNRSTGGELGATRPRVHRQTDTETQMDADAHTQETAVWRWFGDATFLFNLSVRLRHRAHCAHHILLRAHQHLELGYTTRSHRGHPRIYFTL